MIWQRLVVRSEDFFWIIGLLEGEGSFHIAKTGEHLYPRISLHMTDEDIIQKAAEIFETKLRSYQPKNPNYKTGYRTCVCGVDAITWMREIYPHLSNRRQKQIEKVFKETGYSEESLYVQKYAPTNRKDV